MNPIRWIRNHKKLTATVVGAAVQLLPVDHEARRMIAGLLVSFVLGQGLADVGKEKAIFEAANRPNRLPKLRNDDG